MARPRIFTPCPNCGQSLSAREHRTHKCGNAKAESGAGRPPKLERCPDCSEQFSARDLPHHVCPPRMSRQELIGYIEGMAAAGQAGYRIGREWGKPRLDLTLRERLERRSTAQLRSIAAGRGGTVSHNAGRCLVCAHEQREAIEAAVRAGQPLRQIGKIWGMSKDSLRRHQDH